ncbi:hypothetical protein EJB05_13330, partial [Eragrostis curvula]
MLAAMASPVQEPCIFDAIQGRMPGGRRVLVFPLPFQGHINPMLQLADVLHGRGLAVTVLHTYFNALDPALHPAFDFVPVPDGVPADVAESGNVIAIIEAMNAAMEANGSAALRDILQSVLGDQGQPPAACIIFDANLLAVPIASAALGLPTLVLRTASAACLGCFLAYPMLHKKGYLPPQESKLFLPVKELPPLRVRDLFYSRKSNHEGMQKLVARAGEATKNSAGLVINTFDALETAELERIRQQLDIPIWLDTQPSRSVLYVSFGSLASMDSNEFFEVAWGLANSGHPFLWVLRPDLVHDSNGLCLPDGFEDAIEGRGKVIQWAPQQIVLAHRAIGGFWTHNGWNSTLESISEGIPMICRPQFADQMMNTRYVEKRWGVGFELEGELERGKIEIAIRKLMKERDGYEMRERAIGLKEKVADCLKPGGSSRIAIEKLFQEDYCHGELTAMAGVEAEQIGDVVRGGGSCRRRVLMFPLPFQGHINPMLQLADVLHGQGLAVTVLHTHFNALDPGLHPEFNFVPVPDGVPADVAASGNMNSIILAMNAAMEASAGVGDVLASVLGDEGSRAACLVIDANLLAVQKAATRLGLPTLVLRTGSAANMGCFFAFPMLHQKGYLPPQGHFHAILVPINF